MCITKIHSLVWNSFNRRSANHISYFVMSRNPFFHFLSLIIRKVKTKDRKYVRQKTVVIQGNTTYSTHLFSSFDRKVISPYDKLNIKSDGFLLNVITFFCGKLFIR